MLQAKVFNDRSLIQQISRVLNTIRSLGTTYYKLYLSTITSEIIGKTIMLVKTAAQ